MFNFNDDKLTSEQILNIAKQDGLPPLRVAINANGYRQSERFWPGLFPVHDFELDYGTLKVIDIIVKQGRASKGVVGLRALYEAARYVKASSGMNWVMKSIKDSIIPNLDKMGYTCLIGEKIYINPQLLSSDTSWVSEVKPKAAELNVEHLLREVDGAQLKVVRDAIQKLEAYEEYLLTGK